MEEQQVVPMESSNKSSSSVVVANNNKIEVVVMMMSADEMVAKSIAPVKKQFICPPPTNRTTNNNTPSENNNTTTINPVPQIAKEKKSKRQLKRDRQQEQKSALHICPTIAKTANVNSCPHNDKCRFSHDLEAFLLQKPQDLDGTCPFFTEACPCPYGIACRFSGTHNNANPGNETITAHRKNSEINVLDKDVQRLLWKNKMKFPKADATLKLLGLLGPAKNKTNGDTNNNARIGSADGNDCCKVSANPTTENAEEDKPGDVRPPKKTKCLIDDDKLDDAAGQILHEKDGNKSCEENEQETIIGRTPEDTDTDKSLKLHTREKKLIDFSDKLYLAPLTTVGNLPYRRLCKVLGADITCGEMAMCTNLLQGQGAEWALLRRHSSEDFFGVQICGSYPDTVARTVELIEQHCTVDFIDINMGCPIDIVVNKGAGSGLLTKPMRMKSMVEACSRAVDTPLTIKVRTGYFEGKNRIDSLIADIGNWGATAVTIHGRTRQQRYSKPANWDYVYQCARAAPSSLQVLGNGDVFSYLDWNEHKSDCHELSTCMIARGALVKPWIFTEIKEQRHWDISSGERLDILKDYVRFGLEHWGSDSKGVETTRHFLLEWLSYTFRYIPVGLLDVIPQKINWRAPSYYGRDDLETLMASESAADWIRITEMLLGKVPAGFTFSPKHKSNAYDKAENG